MNTSRPRILAIEADPDRRRQLERFLRERVNADVAVAESAEAALRAIHFQPPDLVVASMLLPPRDDAQMMLHLNAIDDASRPAVIMVPPLQDSIPLSPTRRLMNRLRRRSADPFPLYDPDAIGMRIQEALEDSPRRSRALRVVRGGRENGTAGTATGRPGPVASLSDASASDVPIVLPPKPVISRAHRWAPAELPWICSVQTPTGLDARVINVSRSGILIETGSKLSAGSITTVHLSGMDTALMVPARVVRSEVASVEVAGVKYWIAAAFNGRLDPVPEDGMLPPAAASPITPRTLAELLARVAAEVHRGQRGADVKTLFEQGVRQLASAHDVKIREAPAPTSDRESIYFRVPGPSGSRAVLQVIFDPGHRPAADDFVLMKAAAAAAGLVMRDERLRPDVQVSNGGPRNSW